ncbi:MAG: carbonic anhydrase [Methanotrichaceae archaeon]
MAAALALFLISIFASAAEDEQVITGDQALQKLLDGNARFVSGNITHPDQSAERRAETVSAQHPFAVIVGCSDSRVSPEIIFDQGIGDLFVVRTAGEVMDGSSIGSIEYAVEHLNVPLVVVLGHDSCGAVKAAVDGGEAPGHIASLVEAIKPAVDEARSETKNNNEVLNISIDNNINNVVNDLSSSEPILSAYVKKGKLKIVGARYHLQSGKVDLMEQPSGFISPKEDSGRTDTLRRLFFRPANPELWSKA